MGEQYFIKRGERVRGPFTSRQIKSGIRSEKIKQEDLVGRSDAGPWKEVRSIMGQDNGARHQSDASDASLSKWTPGPSGTPSSDTVVNTAQPASRPLPDGPVKGDLTVGKSPPPASVTTRAPVSAESTFSQSDPAGTAPRRGASQWPGPGAGSGMVRTLLDQSRVTVTSPAG